MTTGTGVPTRRPAGSRQRPHLFESTSRFSDRDAFVAGLKEFGFDQFAVEDRWKFTYIRALKARRKPRSDASIRL